MNKQDEIKFKTFKDSLKVFLDFPEVEQSIAIQVNQSVDEMLLDKAQIAGWCDLDALTFYCLSGSSTEERLKLILGLTSSSLERMKRICLQMFPKHSWSEILKNEHFIRQICAVLLDPEKVAGFVPKFIRDCVRIPQNWKDTLSDESKLSDVAMRSLLSKYAVESGIALENKIRRIVNDAGFENEKGKVELVNDKEVDIAIPNLVQPQFLIMSSYQLTTSSAQSSRANEQSNMYLSVQNSNRFAYQKSRPPVRLINAIDGGGWVDRQSDLKKMWINSDLCLSNAQLHTLPDFLRAHYMPTD